MAIVFSRIGSLDDELTEWEGEEADVKSPLGLLLTLLAASSYLSHALLAPLLAVSSV